MYRAADALSREIPRAMTETAKTTEQEHWVLVHDGCESDSSPISFAKLVFVNPGTTFLSHKLALSLAQENPANVLNVDAYLGVVEALERAKEQMQNWLANPKHGIYDRRLSEIKRISTALAAVHPSKVESQPAGDKG